MEEEQITSPIPDSLTNLTFPEALNEILSGKRISKEEWNDEGIYGFMDTTRDNLMIHRNGQDHQWILSEGDMIGEDYFVI